MWRWLHQIHLAGVDLEAWREKIMNKFWKKGVNTTKSSVITVEVVSSHLKEALKIRNMMKMYSRHTLNMRSTTVVTHKQFLTADLLQIDSLQKKSSAANFSNY